MSEMRKLPELYRIFEDGENRFILSYPALIKCPVFKTREEAIDYAYYLEGRNK